MPKHIDVGPETTEQFTPGQYKPAPSPAGPSKVVSVPLGTPRPSDLSRPAFSDGE